MGIDTRDFQALKTFCEPWRGQQAMILGDCTFYLDDMDLERFARACGLKAVHTIDISGDPTIKADLTSIPDELKGRYSVVIDAGTLYWCLDVMAAWRGALSLLDATGGIFHSAGLTGYFGRAYYCFSPKLFRDVYAANHFQITRMAVRATRAADDRMIDIGTNDIYSVDANADFIKFGPEFTKHVTCIPADAQIICEARRNRQWMRRLLSIDSGGLNS
jgi:hypothetical protein